MVRRAHSGLEQMMGIEAYLTDGEGIGGDLRSTPGDFTVDEVSDFKYGTSGDFLVLRLAKENWETHHLIRDLSRQLGIADERIGIAGTKDKRATTSQLMSIRGVSEAQAASVRLPRARLEPLGRAHRDIRLGDLLGNDFRITVRNIALPQPDAAARLAAVDGAIAAAGGVPNFFGHQRFGIVRPVTHLVGKKLVLGDVEGAAMDYIARAFPGETEENKRARDMVFATRDFREGIRQYPLGLRYERAMMHHLVANPGDYAGAFRALSPNLLRLFVHGYQSYLFNRLLSRRLLDGLRLDEPLAGDVVCFADARGGPDPSRTEAVTEKNLPDVLFLIRRRRAYVTLPLIGSDAVPGAGRAGEEARRVLEEEGVRAGDFRVAALPELASAGLRREVLLHVRPTVTTGDGTAEFRFFLPRGCYATTVLREYMKAGPEHMD